jgi:beta-lactamase superfamily II metal-dependent hydrolase
LRKLAEQKSAYRKAQAGDSLDWDEQLDVDVLSPPRTFLGLDSDPGKISEHSLLNGNSLVLRVRHGENVFLFPGDAYGMGQRFILSQVPAEKLRMTVMTAPHHGFNTSPEFAAATRPAVVIASCLADYPGSEIRSPADQAIKMYAPVGSRVYATCRHGRIQVVSDGRTIHVKTERAWDLDEAKP